MQAMKNLWLVLVAILAPGAMATVREESGVLKETALRYPCPHYYFGCFSSISGSERMELPRREPSIPEHDDSFSSRMWLIPESITIGPVEAAKRSLLQQLKSLRQMRSQEPVSKISKREAEESAHPK